MKKKTIIPVALIVLIAVIITGCIFMKEKAKPVSENTDTVSEQSDVSQSAQNKSAQNSAKSSTVIFADASGAEIGKGEISGGRITEIPTSGYEKPGYVFTGWGEDVDSIISGEADSDVTENMSADTSDANNHDDGKEDEEIKAEPQYEETDDKDNAVVIDDEYVPSGEKANVKVKLDGKVDLCAFDIKLTYDSEKIKFVEFADLNENVIANNTQTPGVIRMNYVSTSNIKESFDIGKIVFEQLNENVSTADIKAEIIEAVRLDDSNNIENAAAESMTAEIWFY